MAITPSGKIRIMEAQSINNGILSNNSLSDVDVPRPNDPPVVDEAVSGMSPKVQYAENESDKNLSDYLFDIYVSKFGFEPRVLRPLKSDFVTEEINADQTVNVTVTLPAYYWQTGKKIGSKEVKSLIDEICQQFNLYHAGGSKIGEDEITINLTSVPSEKEGENDEESSEYSNKIRDLYEIYGKQPPGHGTGTKSQSKKAQTLSEMWTDSKNELFNKIQKEP